MTKLTDSSKSSLAKSLIDSLSDPGVPVSKKRSRTVSFSNDDQKPDDGPPSLVKSILNVLNGGGNTGGSIERLAFERDPSQNNSYSSVYKSKGKLLPDNILKRIAIQDDLVASITNCRANHIGSFGRVRPNRHEIGFIIEANKGVMENATPEQKKEIKERTNKAQKRIECCGSSEGWSKDDQLTFSQYLAMSTRNAVTVGRIATETLWITDVAGCGEKQFHSFRPIDAGTIYRAVPQKSALQSVRDSARHLLEMVKNKNLSPERFCNDEYSWVQVIEGRPVQAFTSEECLVHNFYPITDIELDGYPCTPLDTVINAVTTHINIGQHNKAYFQSGRATRGMLVIKSEEVDENVVGRIRQQFNADINSVNAAWRMPVFGVGPEDELTWSPIDSGGRDMEFQFLSDSISRIILSAYQMSPEELPGYSHLAKGTNSQALCLHPSSKIITQTGYHSLGDLLEGKDNSSVNLWTGRNWCESRVFRTGNKPQVTTTLNNGMSLITSPDHRFRTIGSDGFPCWKPQRDLIVGDTVLVNKNAVPGCVSIPEFNGRPLTEDMMEVLGWLTGDGNINVRLNIKTGNIKQIALSWFYHHEKEIEIWKRHEAIMISWGLDVHNVNHIVSENESPHMKAYKGVKTVAPNRLTNRLYDSDFSKWILSLGFTKSSRKEGEGKTIPPFIHVLPTEYRAAFLRGFLSADGTLDKRSGAARIVIHDDRLREQTKELLMGLGIRTQNSEGLNVVDFGYGNRERVKTPGKTCLCIKDKHTFFEKVGFIQPHKQPTQQMKDKPNRWEKISRYTQLMFANKILESPLLNEGSEKNNLRALLNPKFNRSMSVPKCISLLSSCEIPIPTWLTEHYFETIRDISPVGSETEMVDVEVFDSDHAFVANSVVVHNSENNNEYLLEAARDVGIRPLLKNWEDFFNSRIFPLIDLSLSRICRVKFVGLEAQTAEKEAVRIQQDMGIHMTMDGILSMVEKDPINANWGGEFLLNPQWQAIVDKYLPVGEIVEHFFGRSGAAKDPSLAYLRDPFWFQWQQLQQQAQQAQQQAQQPQQQAQQPQPPSGGGGGDQPADGQPAEGNQQEGHQDRQDQQQEQQPDQQEGQDLQRSLDQAIGLLSKTEGQLSPGKRKILAQHRETVRRFTTSWEKDLQEATKEILKVAEEYKKD